LARYVPGKRGRRIQSAYAHSAGPRDWGDIGRYRLVEGSWKAWMGKWKVLDGVKPLKVWNCHVIGASPNAVTETGNAGGCRGCNWMYRIDRHWVLVVSASSRLCFLLLWNALACRGGVVTTPFQVGRLWFQKTTFLCIEKIWS
jgi:hypothetical protein